jgi:NADH dehydrogenase
LALRLGRRLRRGEADVVLVDPHSHLTYQPLLADAAAGDVEPRHVAVPLRRMLRHTKVITAELVSLSHTSRRAVVRLASGEHRELGYQHIVVAPGSVARTLPIPGFAELGYAGIEALGELSDMSAAVTPVFDNIDAADLHWVLVEATGRILPEVGPELATYTLELLRRRGIDVRLQTRILSCVDGRIELDRGDPFETDTLVWTAGLRAHQVLAETDLRRDDKGRLVAGAFLRVRGTDGAWTAGDSAAVPDLTSDTPGALCVPTAQHGVRQARRLADNLVAVLRGRRPRPYRHRYAGSVASLGRLQGVAQIYGVRLCGRPAWLLHRGYHLSRLPSAGRRTRVLADWLLAAVFPRDVVSLGEIHQPRELFVRSLAERAAAREHPAAAGRRGG